VDVSGVTIGRPLTPAAYDLRADDDFAALETNPENRINCCLRIVSAMSIGCQPSVCCHLIPGPAEIHGTCTSASTFSLNDLWQWPS
jgi:hypothetical protein